MHRGRCAVGVVSGASELLGPARHNGGPLAADDVHGAVGPARRRFLEGLPLRFFEGRRVSLRFLVFLLLLGPGLSPRLFLLVICIRIVILRLLTLRLCTVRSLRLCWDKLFNLLFLLLALTYSWH